MQNVLNLKTWHSMAILLVIGKSDSIGLGDVVSKMLTLADCLPCSTNAA
jgi:hypothetical protein